MTRARRAYSAPPGQAAVDSFSPLLELCGVTVSFGGRKNRTTAVSDVSLAIRRGETLGLVGESGSGKTTIGRAVMRLTPLQSGSISFDGGRIDGALTRERDRELTRRIQMIFQDPMSSLNERAKVEYIVSEGLYGRGMQRTAIREATAAALADVGMPADCMSRFPHEFSGGQRQRIGIARAMVMQPELIIADEPVSALDVSVRAEVLNLMRTLAARRALTMLFISHDLSVVRYIADNIAVIRRGELVEYAPCAELFRRPLHPYTRSLIAAIPVPDPRRSRLLDPPQPLNTPPGRRIMRSLPGGHLVRCTEQEYISFKRGENNVY